jgi:hypothetical protein
MTWKPTLAQLETIADMSHARAPVAAMASAVGLSPEAFIAWRRRLLVAVRVEEAAEAPPYAMPDKPAVSEAPAIPRIVADRVFERPEGNVSAPTRFERTTSMMNQKDVTAAFESGLEYRDFLISQIVAANSAPAAREKAFQRYLLKAVAFVGRLVSSSQKRLWPPVGMS